MLASEYGYKCWKEIMNVTNVELVGIVTTSERFVLHYGQGMKKEMMNPVYARVEDEARQLDIPIYVIDKMNSDNTISVINNWNPDIIVVTGWYHLIGEKILSIPRYGVVGLHSSLLPKYRGGAPLVWQMINGEKEAGITLFYMDTGLDSGDIIGQKSVTIEYTDTIATLYDKVGRAGITLLKESLYDISIGKIVRRKQNNLCEDEIYPQRNPHDGEIDWNQTSRKIYDFIRAQTKPYPGAFFRIGEYKIVIWTCSELAIEKGLLLTDETAPGTIVKIDNNKGTFVVLTGDDDCVIEVNDYDVYNSDEENVGVSKHAILSDIIEKCKAKYHLDFQSEDNNNIY